MVLILPRSLSGRSCVPLRELALLVARATLDATVVKAYGWDDCTPAMSDDEILARLLKLNRERAAAQ